MNSVDRLLFLFVIASEAKQSSLACFVALDCFASLAMTAIWFRDGG
jgi:hypothetical protein